MMYYNLVRKSFTEHLYFKELNLGLKGKKKKRRYRSEGRVSIPFPEAKKNLFQSKEEILSHVSNNIFLKWATSYGICIGRSLDLSRSKALGFSMYLNEKSNKKPACWWLSFLGRRIFLISCDTHLFCVLNDKFFIKNLQKINKSLIFSNL